MEMKQTPVAWQRRTRTEWRDEWSEWRYCSEDQAAYAIKHGHPEGFKSIDAEVRPLYLGTPHTSKYDRAGS